ncbi:hypothetical protein HMPREF0004_5751, partial [Achromobacter piechaudii ATCC 43553]
PGRGAGGTVDRRVDADKPPGRIEQGPPELPGLMAAPVWTR